MKNSDFESLQRGLAEARADIEAGHARVMRRFPNIMARLATGPANNEIPAREATAGKTA